MSGPVTIGRLLDGMADRRPQGKSGRYRPERSRMVGSP